MSKIKLNKPPKLNQGDTVGVVAPSSGGAQIFPHRVENAEKMLNKLGYKVKYAKNTLKCSHYVSASPPQRAADIHQMFTDKSIKAIICTIGGNHANQILKYLDFNLIKNNPKIFIGYSDISVLHYAFATQANLQTFYGPCLITQFGEYPAILPYTLASFNRTLTQRKNIGNIIPSPIWTAEILDWSEKKDMERPRRLHRSSGYQWLKLGTAEAQIIGGCIPSINHLAGTKYWLSPQNKIFFIDLPEGDEFGQGLPLSYVDSYLADLDNLGLFSTIKGLIIGRPYNYSLPEIKQLRRIILNYTANYNYPVLLNVNIGHCDPIITLPYGASVVLNSQQNLFTVNDSGVQY
jgi:muramoyltetrapeptide carboxypeptidase LdcA involved in peptidoglycan recycling